MQNVMIALTICSVSAAFVFWLLSAKQSIGEMVGDAFNDTDGADNCRRKFDCYFCRCIIFLALSVFMMAIMPLAAF